MEVIPVSPSRLAVFVGCEWQYVAKYILKLPDESGPKTRLGSGIHELFECLSAPSKHEKRRKYIEFSIANEGLHPTIHRYLYKIYKKFTIPEDLYLLGVKLVYTSFIKGYDRTSKVLDVEKRFEIPITEHVSIKGFIDKVIEIDKDTIELIDFKSGQPKNEIACQEEYQPYFYKIAAKILYPNYKYHIFSFHFLKNRKIITVDKSQEELDQFLKFIVAQGIAMLKITKENATCTKSFKCTRFCQARLPMPEHGYTGCPAFFDKNSEPLYKQY